MHDEPGTFLCGEVQPLQERTVLDGKELCANCLSERTVPCAHCGQPVWVEAVPAPPLEPLCPVCADRENASSDEILPSLTVFQSHLRDLGRCVSSKGALVVADRVHTSILAADSSEAFSSKAQCREAAEKRLRKAYQEVKGKMARITGVGLDSFYNEFKRHFDARLAALKEQLETLHDPANAQVIEAMLRHMTASPIHKAAGERCKALSKEHPLPAFDDFRSEIVYDVWDPSDFEEGVAKLIAKGFVRHSFDCNEAIRTLEIAAETALSHFREDFNAQIQEEILSHIVEPVEALLPQLWTAAPAKENL